MILREALPVRAVDPDVIAKARERNRILISLNGDFSDIVANPPEKYNGMMSFQLHNRPELIPQLQERLKSLLTLHPDQEYYKGKLFIIEAHRIRIRH